MRSMIGRPMARTSDVSTALATLQARWGTAAPRRGGDMGLVTEGALARAPLPLEPPDEDGLTALPSGQPGAPLVTIPGRRPGVPVPDAEGRIVPTGFAALDAIL